LIIGEYKKGMQGAQQLTIIECKKGIRGGNLMNFKFDHNNINVLDLEKSISFYKEALGFEVVRTHDSEDKSFKLAFLGDNATNHKLELTWLRDRTEPYNLGDNEIHLAVRVDDFETAYEHHKNMGCICYENKGMGLYFINDPDGYWIEILPTKHNVNKY
jgi:lactoylglutathione lyase